MNISFYVNDVKICLTHILKAINQKNVPIDMKCRMKMEKAMQAVMLEAM